MPNNFNFMGNPIVPGQPQMQMPPMQQPMMPQMMVHNQNIGYVPPQMMSMQQQPMYPAYTIPDTPPPEEPLVKEQPGSLGFNFTIIKDEENENNNMTLTIPDAEEMPPARKKGRPRKSLTMDHPIRPTGVGDNTTVEDPSAIYTYAATTLMLHDTVGQLDLLANEIKSEMDDVRLSRTAHNKYNNLIGLSTALGKILETKVTAISQINSAISKANDLDYKREKDRKAVEANQAMDDKRLMDLYQSFVANPMGVDNNVTTLGPTSMQTIIGGSPIIRADTPDYTAPTGPADAGYLNYLSNLTPEQNMMYYENNPNVQTCVIYDASSGNKFFQVMDISTGQAVPNVQAIDNRFMEDTFIDLKSKTASNNNLHQTYPVIVINEGVTSQY